MILFIYNKIIMYIILDTETNGLPDSKGLRYGEYPNYKIMNKYDTARVIQLSYMICDNKLNQNELVDNIIYAENFEINNPIFHGITNEISQKDGYSFDNVINIFYNKIQKCEKIIAHNVNFDINVLKSELYRRKLFHIIIELEKKELICSVKKFKNIVKAKNKYNRIKDPSLKELYKFAFNKELENAHNSKYDVINLHAAIKKITNGEL